VLGGGGLLLGLAASSFLVERLQHAPHSTMAQLLLGLKALQMVTLVTFGLAAGFALALAASWAAWLARSLVYPVSRTWLNQNIDDSSVRATVISMTGQSDDVAQIAGGPAIGAIGNALGLRAALVASGLILTPALTL
jgi:DHA3 family tetracycline resistance protein-like MFS transporter